MRKSFLSRRRGARQRTKQASGGTRNPFTAAARVGGWTSLGARLRQRLQQVVQRHRQLMTMAANTLRHFDHPRICEEVVDGKIW